jgi:hypothetical protein
MEKNLEAPVIFRPKTNAPPPRPPVTPSATCRHGRECLACRVMAQALREASNAR